MPMNFNASRPRCISTLLLTTLPIKSRPIRAYVVLVVESKSMHVFIA